MMATRPVYSALDHAPYFNMENVDFVWNPGLAPSQKKKNSKAIEAAYLEKHPGSKVLEVSTKSDKEEGLALSPFNLKKTLKSMKKAFPIENIYQASKVYEHAGPFTDLLMVQPLEAKRDARKESSGAMTKFSLEGKDYPISPEILFYNWLYIQALLEQPEIAKAILENDAFTDVEYSPSSKTQNNQARACAIYKSLHNQNLLHKAFDFDEFASLFKIQPAAVSPIPETTASKKPKRRAFKKGDWVSHPGLGKGEILKKDRQGYLINFPVAGPRVIVKDFVELNCQPVRVNDYNNF